MNAKKLNKQNFQNEIINNQNIALVDFYADWCGPCKVMAPIIDEIADERPDITVGKVNVDEQGELAMEYRVASIPTLLLFKNGKLEKTSVGFMPKAALMQELGL